MKVGAALAKVVGVLECLEHDVGGTFEALVLRQNRVQGVGVAFEALAALSELQQFFDGLGGPVGHWARREKALSTASAGPPSIQALRMQRATHFPLQNLSPVTWTPSKE